MSIHSHVIFIDRFFHLQRSMAAPSMSINQSIFGPHRPRFDAENTRNLQSQRKVSTLDKQINIHKNGGIDGQK